MQVIKRQVKMPKTKLYRQLPNNHGLRMYLYGCSKYVGFFVVTKELTYDCLGYMCAMTHEEFKSKAYLECTLEGIENA